MSDQGGPESREPAAVPPRNAATRRPSAIGRTLAAATDRVARLVPSAREMRLGQRDDHPSAYRESVRRAFLTAESIEPARPRRRAALEGEATRADPAERTQLDAPPEPHFNILAQAVASPPASLTTAPILTDAPATPSPVPPGATDLIQAPASVTAATDDFFAGLVRRVERRA